MKHLQIALLCIVFHFTLLAQDRAEEESWQLNQFPRSMTSVGWDLGGDFSSEPSYRLGYTLIHEEQSCVLGTVRMGLAAGLSFQTDQNTTGVYLHKWLSFGPLNGGLKLSYERSNRAQWFTFQPQIGVGLQRLRIFYGFNANIFIKSQVTVPKHVLGIGYSFGVSHIRND